MASFYGSGSDKASRRFESEFFVGDEMFQLDVQPVGPVKKRVVDSDPLLGFDPTVEPSRAQAPILQPPAMGGRMPLTCGRPREASSVLSTSYKESLLRDDEALGEQPLEVWGRLGRSSLPNVTSSAAEVGNDDVKEI